MANELRARRPSRVVAVVIVAIAAAMAVVGGARPVGAYPTASVNITGHGWGHGRGMGQYGAQGYALAGWSYGQILNHFYGGTTSTSPVGNPSISVHITRKDGMGVQFDDAAPGNAVYVQRIGANQFRV